MKVSILVENYASKFPHAEWGLSILVERKDQTFLFDSGLTGSIAVKNAMIGNISLADISDIIISHGHYDHGDGLQNILKATGDVKLWCHDKTFISKFTRSEDKNDFAGIKYLESELIKYGADIKKVNSDLEIMDGVNLITNVVQSSSFEKIPEKFLIKSDNNKYLYDNFEDEISIGIESKEGIVLLIGCGHRGIVNIVKHAQALFKRKIYAVIGGTHLVDADKHQIDKTVDFFYEERIPLVAPGHCTGFEALAIFKKRLGNRIIPSFCGEVFNFTD